MGFCDNCNKEVESRFCPSCGKEIQTQVVNQENIKELVSDLYALRAGLSLVSMEKDDADAAQRKYEQEENLFNLTSNQLNAELEDCSNQFDKELEDRKTAYEDWKSSYELNQRRKSENSRKLGLSIFYVFLTLILGAGATALFGFVITPALWGGFDGFFGPLPTIFTCIFTIGATIFFFVIAVKSASDAHYNYTSTKKRFKELSEVYMTDEEFENALQSTPELISLSNQYDRIEEQKNKHLETGLYKELQERNTKIATHTQRGLEIYESLVPHYSQILDERDWQNLDLVIFMLETRRADTIKEALHHVDRVRQTEQIVQMVSSATETICGTINRGFASLQSSMISCASILSSQLTSIRRTQNVILDEISDTKHAVYQSYDMLNQSLSTALVAKKDTSSKQLAEDIHQLRVYADIEATKGRNS